MRGDDVLGVFFFGNRVTNEKVGCGFWSAGLSGLEQELGVVEGAEGGMIVGVDGV